MTTSHKRIQTMSIAAKISEAAGALQAELKAHPECDGGLAAQAALEGRPRRHAAFYLGRFPDIEAGEGRHAPPPPPYASPKTGTVNDQDWASIHCFPPWEDTPAPALVRNVVAKGLSLYSAAPLETVDTGANNRLITALFKELLGDRPACAADAHPAVWMNVQHQPEKKRFTVAFLNQQTQEPPLPIPSLRFRLRRPEGGRFTGLTLAPGQTPVPFSLDERGDLHAELRGLAIFEMLVAEYKKDATAPRRQKNREN